MDNCSCIVLYIGSDPVCKYGHRSLFTLWICFLDRSMVRIDNNSNQIRVDQFVNIVIPVVETYRNHTFSLGTEKSELDAVLLDDDFRKKFLKFCEQSFAPENLLCWYVIL